MDPLRVYADTSVYGGVFDEDFSEPSHRFFDRVREGRFTLVLSAVVQAELRPAPESVRLLMDEMLHVSQIAAVTEAAIVLQQAYLAAGVVTPKSADDALHVALATVSSCA
jgi:predicted nucleic acid-binding protein